MAKATTTTKKNAASTKVCYTTLRVEIKKGILAGCLCHRVKSEKTVKGQLVISAYEVWRYADGMYCCNCAATKECYHIRHVQAWEEATASERQARHEAREAKKVAQQAEASPAQVCEVAAIAEQTETQRQAEAAKDRPNCETSQAASQRRMNAPLNGNQGFSLLKKAS